MPQSIMFFKADRPIPVRNRQTVKKLVLKIFRDYNRKVDWVHFIFCSDITLLQLNTAFLKHDYYTDIITFPLQKSPVQGEIHISIDRVKENAANLGIPFSTELLRVMVHGALHLCDEKDKTPAQQRKMRKIEDFYIGSVPRET